MERPVAATVAIGGARVTALLDSEGAFFVPLREAFPTADEATIAAAARLDPPAGPDAETWWLSFRVYVVELDERVVLVDTGAASPTAARSTWTPMGPHLTDRLKGETGIAADQVTHVVLTHLHGDHAAGSVDVEGHPAFPHAEYILQADEVAAVEAGGAPLEAVLVDPLRRSGQLRICHGETALVPGATSVRLIPTPGHTPGHQSVLVTDDDRVGVLAGDVFLHAVQLVDPGLRYAFDADDEQAADTRRAVLDRLRRPIGFLGTAHLTESFLPTSSLPVTGAQ